PVIAPKFFLHQLLLLLLYDVVVFFLFLLIAIVAWRRRIVSAHRGSRLEPDGSDKKGGGGQNADTAECEFQAHGGISPVREPLDDTMKPPVWKKTIREWGLVPR